MSASSALIAAHVNDAASDRRARRLASRGVRRIRWLTVAAIALTGLTWFIAITVTETERLEQFKRDAEQAQRLAVFFERQTLAGFHYGDSYLKMIRRNFEQDFDTKAIAQLMSEVQLQRSIASHVTIIDADGTPIFNSAHALKPGTSAADRDYFKWQQQSIGDELFISLPHRGRNSGKLVIRMVRRYTGPDGKFAGVMFIAMVAKNVTSFFNSMSLGPKSSATLVGTDKRIRARSSYGRLGPGQDISGSRLWRELKTSPTGLYKQVSVVDNVLRHYAYRKLDNYPMVVAIGIATDDIDEATLAFAEPANAIAALATLLILSVAFLLSREFRVSARLAASEANVRTIVQTVRDGIVSFDRDGRIDSFSRGASAIFGWQPDEVIGRNLRLLGHNADDVTDEAFVDTLLNGDSDGNRRGAHREFSARHKSGMPFPAEIAIGTMGEGDEQFFVGTVRDLSDSHAAAEALYEARERAQVTLHSIGDAVISTTADGKVEFLNPIAESLTGWSVDEAAGMPLQEIFRVVHESTRAPITNLIERRLSNEDGDETVWPKLLISRNGHEYAIEESAAPIRGNNGKILGVVVVFKDVTEARQLSRAVTYQASHDALTGLVNRQEIEKRLRRVYETAQASDTENVFCFLDLDQFKLVNDTCGHVAGDELLRQITDVIVSKVRPRDTLGRLGGDEFGLLMEHCSIDDASRIANALVEEVRGFPFIWDDTTFRVGVSIGMVAVVKGSVNCDELLRLADSACYAAKESGRSRVHVYREADARMSQRHGEMRWAVRLPKALEEDRFELHAQIIEPISANGEPGKHHYEVLLRMIGEDGELVAPGSFLPAAERYNLATEIDAWVIEHVFRLLGNSPQHLQELELCAINLSALSLGDEAFMSELRKQFDRHNIPPGKICFEITETAAIGNLAAATSFIRNLRELGCRFALDDFGIGLSSFAYLKNLPVDILKIDGLFVKDIVDDATDLAFVRSINDIGNAMGMQTVAEFVENDFILNKLREVGVSYAQGFGIARPVPLTDIIAGAPAQTRKAS